MSLVETLGWGDEEVDQTTSQRGQLGFGSNVIKVFPHLICCAAPPPRLRLHLQEALPLYLPPTKLKDHAPVSSSPGAFGGTSVTLFTNVSARVADDVVLVG